MLESAGDCAKQRCVPRPSETVRGGVVYSCASSDYNERCVVSGNFECTNQSCFSSGDSGSEIEVQRFKGEVETPVRAIKQRSCCKVLLLQYDVIEKITVSILRLDLF